MRQSGTATRGKLGLMRNMPDWLTTYLGALQNGLVGTLATEMRAGGIATVWLAFVLGTLNALTPGHGKMALAAYLLGREARVGKGVRIALAAALVHVMSGFVALLALRFVVGQAYSITGRGSPTITILGYGLIIIAGGVMLLQSLRPASAGHDGVHALTAGIGLLPCPLTISVLGFTWIQGTAVMVAVVLAALALGIATTIGIVAVVTILSRDALGQALAHRLPQVQRGARILQGIAGVAIIVIGVLTLSQVRL
jgi:ABC-type nickel/cobalt efflux system permease component RcnA